MDPSRPDRVASPTPILPHRPSPAEDLGDFNLWWDRDNVAQHILVSHLGSLPRGLLPSPNISSRTALSIYKMLTQYFGTCNFADCTELLNALHNSSCTAGRVQEYVTKWRSGFSGLQSAKFVLNIKICISLFVRGLPLISAFTSLRASLPERLSVITTWDLFCVDGKCFRIGYHFLFSFSGTGSSFRPDTTGSVATYRCTFIYIVIDYRLFNC